MRVSMASAWLTLALACSSVAPPAAQPETPPAADEATVASAAEPPLYLALTQLQTPGDIVDVLPGALLEMLQAQVAELTPEQKKLLLEGQDPVVTTRPLLYVAAGGRDPSIVSLIFSSSAASNELVALARGANSEQDLAAASNALVERAAQWVIHSRAEDLSSAVEHKREHLQEVVFAASVLERQDLERLALLELSERYPDPAWTLALIRQDVASLAVDEAAQRLNAASLPSELAQSVKQEIELASSVASATEAPQGVEQAVELARRQMALGMPERAEKTLRPFAGEAAAHLALATALARAVTGASACPTVVGAAAANEYVCQQVWARLLAKPEVLALDAAWKSGQGRDAEAIETYIGLSHVVPLMYGLTADGSQQTATSARSAFSKIEEVAKQGAESAPYFEGVALMAAALGLAMDAATNPQSPRATLEPKLRKQLVSRATTLAGKLPAEPWIQAAVLGVAAMTSREERLDALLSPLQGSVERQYETLLGTLQLWDVLADGDEARYQELQEWFGQIATNHEESPFQRSKWLFLWAEAGAHVEPSTQTYSTVRKIAENLEDERVPLDLRLRARMDRAGLLARANEIRAAVDVLAPIVQNTSRGAIASHDEQELLIAATGYLSILNALASSGEGRQEHVAQLEKLLLDVGRSRAAPPTLQLWLMLWRAEFDYKKRHDECNANAACERRAADARGADDKALAQAIGERSAQLLKRGVLPVGGVQLEFRYLGRGRLAPRLQVSPRFLLAHSPPL